MGYEAVAVVGILVELALELGLLDIQGVVWI